MKNTEKRSYTKPSKFPKFLEAMKLALQDERTVILTDMELHVLVNHRLEPQDRVSYKTFESWKSPTGKRRVEAQDSISAEDADEFRQTLAYSRVYQKMNLTGNMMDEDNKNQWGSSWILERKFEDLKKQPMVQLNSNPLIQITAGDAESQRMIDELINGETIDISHSEEDNTPKLGE